MAQQLMLVFGRNRDGQLTTTEFTSLLSEPLSNRTLSSEATATAADGSGATRRTDHLSGFTPAKFEASQSIEYKFARAAMQFDVSTVKDKAGAESLLNQMRPAMAREGLQVLDISKDKIRIIYEGQSLWVDVIQGSSSGTPMFQWMPIA